jgi:signal peptidase I
VSDEPQAEDTPAGEQKWAVPAPQLNGMGKPMRVRAPYPPSAEQSQVPASDGDDATAEAETEVAVENEASAGRSALATKARSWAETVAVFAVGLVLALLLRAFLLQAFSIPSDSMVPTLLSGDRVVVWKPSDSIAELHQGDVVVFQRPTVSQCPFGSDDPQDLIKRVIGLPGQTITSPSGQVMADGKPLDESYLPPGTVTDMSEPITVPEGHLLMLGDNRGASKDGRCFGPISEDAIVGRATARVWPPGRIGGL